LKNKRKKLVARLKKLKKAAKKLKTSNKINKKKVVKFHEKKN